MGKKGTQPQQAKQLGTTTGHADEAAAPAAKPETLRGGNPAADCGGGRDTDWTVDRGVDQDTERGLELVANQAMDQVADRGVNLDADLDRDRDQDQDRDQNGAPALDPAMKRAPLWEAMRAYRDRNPARFHVPGHKGGAGLDPEAAELAGMAGLDVTELSGLDDLHEPAGVIAEAEQLAAACFGAARTRFLVGGSTAGNLALILAVCKPGDVLLVQRDAHKSVFHGLMLAGARAVFLPPRIDPASGLACGLDPDVAEAALEQYPNARGLFLTDPNYYGFGTDLVPIVKAAHRRGVPVLVDAAHGAHYGFHPALPPAALAAGADGVVQSTHKMLTAFTMGAMLHLQGDLLRRDEVDRALSVIQTSSPSYPIMASLDLARRQLALDGVRLLDRSVAAAVELRERLAAMPWLEMADPDPAGRIGPVTRDPLKLSLRDRTGTLDGYDLAAELEERGCFPEMADPVFVTLALGLSTDSSDIRRLADALADICARERLSRQELQPPIKNIYKSEQSGTDREGEAADTTLPAPVAFQFHDGDESALQAVPLTDATGAVSGRAIVPYPPGVPLVVPGERITAAAVSRLQAWQAAGLRIHGLAQDGTVIIRTNGDQP